MAPKSSSKGGKGPASSKASGSSGAGPLTPPPPIVFPPFSSRPRCDRRVETLLEDQIVVVHNFFNDQDCESFMSFLKQKIQPLMIASPPAKRGEAKRTNSRFLTFAPEFANRLYLDTGLDQIVQGWPSDPLHPKRGAQLPAPKGLLENIRVYRYDEGEYFGPHYDESVPSPVNPKLFSQWTLLIYLSDKGVPVEGGETIFHLPGKKGDKMVVRPERGAAMLHKHGASCMSHEGAVVRKGVKWVLRSDLLFG